MVNLLLSAKTVFSNFSQMFYNHLTTFYASGVAATYYVAGSVEIGLLIMRAQTQPVTQYCRACSLQNLNLRNNICRMKSVLSCDTEMDELCTTWFH